MRKPFRRIAAAAAAALALGSGSAIPSGGSAHSILTWVEVGNFTASGCKPTTASLIRVFPPNRKSAAFSFFSLRGCRATRPLFTHLYVTMVQPGVGHAV